MVEAIRVLNRTAIPVRGLDRARIFSGIRLKSGDNRAAQTEILRRLRAELPELLGDSAQPDFESQVSNIWMETAYLVILANGRVNGQIEVTDDLGKRILDSCLTAPEKPGEKSRINDLLGGKSGVFVYATYDLGSTRKGALRLGRQALDAMYSSSNEPSFAFQKALNALCKGRELDVEDMFSNHLAYPLRYNDGIGSVTAYMKDPLFRTISAADKPVGEFMRWLADNSKEVNSMGELIRLAAVQFEFAKETRKRADSKLVIDSLPTTVMQLARDCFKHAKELYSKLKPPENDRMDYLAN
ncbi:hypothetical protein HY988_05890 [Candidatus Micrarchaeota archaeon]|nr:hypothetical protein [Candidatus Micrarchaeota archaeon]